MTTIEEFEKNYENFMVGSVDTMVSYLKEGDVFLDIGANTGLVSSKIYDRVKLGKLILIEPIKPYYEECIRKFSNKDNVEFYNIGFSDENTKRPWKYILILLRKYIVTGLVIGLRIGELISLKLMQRVTTHT
jgi:hypothetical protein